MNGIEPDEGIDRLQVTLLLLFQLGDHFIGDSADGGTGDAESVQIFNFLTV